MIKQLYKKAFTLVELIVVITILAILGTIAFLSFQGYSRDARDSKRTSDINNLKTSLELFNVNTGKYPAPDSYTTITYSGGTEKVWYQGIAGNQVTINLKQLNEKPLDPLTNEPYIYSVTNSYNEYEVLALYEGNVAQVPSPIRRGLGGGLVPYANAATTTLTPKIVGNYNGVFVKTKHYIIPVPSIVTSEDIAPGIGKALTTGLIKSLVITNGTNIPKTAVSQTSTGQLNINLAVYTGSITSKSPILKILRAVKHIQNTYSGTSLVNNDIISNILNKTTNEQLLTLGNATILKGLQPVSTKIDWRDLDPNCDIPDITIGSQTWAGCNSTLGVGLEWGQLDTDIGTNNYSGTGVCSGYSWNSYPCTVGNSNMASNAKANEWFTGSNSNGDYEVANIWGKFYLYSGATLGERDLIPDTLINPDNNSICPNGYHVPSNQEWEYAEEYLYDGTQNLSGCRTNNQLQQCITVGWYNHSTTNISTSIVEKLKLPLSGIRNKGPNHSYGNRGKTAKLWTSSYQYSSTPIEFYIVFNLDTLSHPGNNRFAPDSYAYNVRCIKD